MKHQNQPQRRCLARTRRGTACQSYPISGKKRCRLHGGTNPGAPKGNKNAWKHGRYSAAHKALGRNLRALLSGDFGMGASPYGR